MDDSVGLTDISQFSWVLWAAGIAISTFLFCLGSYAFLNSMRKRTGGFLYKLFYISARKSSTDAMQFGGLPLAIGLIMVWILFGRFGASLFSQDSSFSTIFFHAIIPGTLITIYGYFDDKFELRPIIKLLTQFIVVTVYALFTSRTLYPEFSSVSFLIVSFFGLGVINGKNLLDGLDTLTIKLSLVSYMHFVILGLFFHIPTVTAVALISVAPLFAFYFFNREPAKIHLGEIGGTFIGLSLIVLSSLLHRGIIVAHSATMAQATLFALIPLSLPMAELSISFLRRMVNGRSPFSGDKFHVHHILRNYWKWSASKVATVMALVYLCITVISLACSFLIHPLGGYIAKVLLLGGAYFYVGRKYWFGKNKLDFSAKSLFHFIRKKDVMILETAIIDEFKISLVENPEVEIHEEDENSENTTKKVS